MKTKSKKNSNGWSLQGQCIQWICDNEELSPNELSVYVTILRNSFGFKKRWCYLKYSDFKVARGTLKRVLDNLKSLGIISYSNTFNPENGNRGMNEYKILEPKQHIRNFIFIGSKDYVEEEKEEDKNPWEE